jgi:hypothetical protein
VLEHLVALAHASTFLLTGRAVWEDGSSAHFLLTAGEKAQVADFGSGPSHGKTPFPIVTDLWL